MLYYPPNYRGRDFYEDDTHQPGTLIRKASSSVKSLSTTFFPLLHVHFLLYGLIYVRSLFSLCSRVLNTPSDPSPEVFQNFGHETTLTDLSCSRRVPAPSIRPDRPARPALPYKDTTP